MRYYNISLTESTIQSLKEEIGYIKRRHGQKTAHEIQQAIDKACIEDRDI